MKTLILILFTVGLLGLLMYTPVYAENIGLIEGKKWRATNSPEVCGDKLCKELEGYGGIPPLKQFNEGISLEKIRCKQGFELVLKTSNNHPACVKESSIVILLQRGWATVIDIIIKQHIPVDAESSEKARQIGAKVVLASESFVMERNNPTITITSSDIKGNDAIIFEGTGFRGLHIIDIIITNEFGFKVELKTKTGQNGVLHMPWILFFEPLDPGIYNVKFSDRVSSHDITIKVGDIEKKKEKTKLRLIHIPTSRFNGGVPLVFSGNLFTDSGKIIRDAEILMVSDGPCPADGIIAKGQTDNRGKFRIMVETMVWDPSDNMVRIHAEYLGDEFYGPSSTQSEIIVVYPIKDTKRC